MAALPVDMARMCCENSVWRTQGVLEVAFLTFSKTDQQKHGKVGQGVQTILHSKQHIACWSGLPGNEITAFMHAVLSSPIATRASYSRKDSGILHQDIGMEMT